MYTYQPYHDKSGKHRFITTGSYLFETEEKAKEFCDLWNEHWEAMKHVDAVMPALSRAAYEAACQFFAVEVMTDERCDSYGVRYGDFGPYMQGMRMAAYTPKFCVQMALARRRQGGIEQERKAATPQPQRPKPQPVAEKLCDCGHYTAHPMTTSSGTSCPDCYDRMSQ